MVRTPEEIAQLLEEANSAQLRSAVLKQQSDEKIARGHLLVAEVDWIKHHAQQHWRQLQKTREQFEQPLPFISPSPPDEAKD